MVSRNLYGMLNVSSLARDRSEEIDRAFEVLSNLFEQREGVASNSEPRYVISVASRMVGIEAHTLRYYEKLGLVQPRRSGGNTRLYSQEDVDCLCCAKALMGDLGVNLPGVELALHLMQRMEAAQHRFEEMENRLRRYMEGNSESDTERREE
ncbi:MAG: MerR family transcriptional regulator [Dehalococcoidia bacterium]|nr:MerR family transcriptional regulator [Dehalococcoidia bacterium]